MRNLYHPHIVPVYDAGIADGCAFIVMKYLKGQALSERFSNGGIEEGEALRIVWQVCSALEHAHSKGVLHRDIKPSNILEDEHGNFFLADFGVSAAGFLPRMTAKGIMVGSLNYMAPEAVSGSISESTDVYALGATLHELLFGIPIFEADSSISLIHKICYDDPPWLSGPAGSGGLGALELLRGLTHKSISSRIATATEARLRIESLLEKIPSHTVKHERPKGRGTKAKGRASRTEQDIRQHRPSGGVHSPHYGDLQC